MHVLSDISSLVEALRCKPAPSTSEVKIVAIDGPGGAGKSSLARRLAAELGAAPILHTDDFASWENPVDWWPEMLERAIEPLAAGKPARFEPTDWSGDGPEEVTIEPNEYVILEGVSASRTEFRPYLTYTIWVDAPAELRLERGLERDGEGARALWEKWMAEEDDFFGREKLREKADLVLPGDQDLWV